MAEKTLNVVVAIDFNDEIMERISNVSQRLKVTRHFPDVPNHVWEDVDILYTVRHFPEPEQTPHLRWIQLNYAGVDKVINKAIVQNDKVSVTTTSGIHAQPIANYCLMMMLAFNYKLPHMMNDQRQKVWLTDPHAVYQPLDMHRQTVGIIGYGTIGREIARVCHALGMNVLATKRDLKHLVEQDLDFTPPNTGDPNAEIPSRLYPPEATAVMVRECDYVIATIPLTSKNYHSINASIFENMKRSAYFINIARGGVVNEADLVKALENGDIAGAALDVFEEEPLPKTSHLWAMENVIISPHTAGNSVHYHEKAADLFIENLQRYLAERPLLNLVKRDLGY
jgi:phosphoglycerate dehydrogenase-like enzyme